MALKIAINGTGRIGMIAARIIGSRSDVELVGINTTADLKTLELLLRNDSVHGRFDVKLIDENTIKIGKDTVKIFSDRDPNNIDFSSVGAELVLECTGKFLTTEKAKAFVKGNVKKVVMSAPAKDDTPMYVLNVNTDKYNGEAIISNASCTTNCLAPIVKVLNDTFGLENGLMTTIHSYTNDQNILDAKHSDIRRARAGALSMIPTTTGAARAIGKVMPELKGKLNGYAMRVPTPDVSVVDLTANLTKEASVEAINEAFLKASEGAFKNLIEYDTEERVSSDFITSTYSAIFVPDMTTVIDGKTIKVLAWYDNEWGYTSRLIDMALFVGTK
jgi:glyceraldehyde 3-phosphate dehydrogenase